MLPRPLTLLPRKHFHHLNLYIHVCVCVCIHEGNTPTRTHTPMYANAQGGPSRQQSGGSHSLLLGRHQSVHTQTHRHECTQTQIGMYTNTKRIHGLLNRLLLPPHTCKQLEMYSCIHKCTKVLTGYLILYLVYKQRMQVSQGWRKQHWTLSQQIKVFGFLKLF